MLCAYGAVDKNFVFIYYLSNCENVQKGELMMLKICLRISPVCILVLLAACSNGGRQQNSSEDISAYTPSALTVTWTTWQEAYAALLRDYASQCPYAADFPLAADRGWGRHFALHDIDRNGFPELFLMLRHRYGDVTYSAVYTFIDGKVVPLEFQSIVSWGGIFSPLDGGTFIIDVDDSVGMGTIYHRWDIDGLTLVTTAQGHAVELNEAGFEKLNDLENWRHSYEWFYLHITTDGWASRRLVTIEEFESIFLRRDERKRLEILPITEESIEQSIFGRY